MQYATLGNTAIKVSRLCVGCMSFGERFEDFLQWTLDYEHSREIIAHALELGVNFFDTANIYSHGTSEEFLGRALQDLKVKREDVVLASKVYFNEGHLSRAAILREIDGTLKRLKTDYLDLYQIHRFDFETPIEETMGALNELIVAGKVRAIGASAMYGYQFHNMQLAAERNGYAIFSTLQNHYNLIYREDERDLIPVARQYNVSLVPYSPLASGHLCRAQWDSGSERSKTDNVMHQKYDEYRDNNLLIVERVNKLAEQKGVSMTEVALSWLLHRGVTAPIVGPSKLSHFDVAVKAVDLKLSEDELKFLEEPYKAHDVVGALKGNIMFSNKSK